MKTDALTPISRTLLTFSVLGLLPAAALAADAMPGSTFRDCEHCPVMVVIPAGSFMMGSPFSESDLTDEKPLHEVTIANNIAVGKTELTFDEWDVCVEAGRCPKADDGGYGRGNYPVINVSWLDAQVYVGWLGEITGARYRLLSEAEFEYAVRAGTTTPWFWGEAEAGWGSSKACEYANLYDAAGKEAHPTYAWSHHKCNDGYAENAPTGKYKPNQFGLYDMLGNVREWIEDCHQKGYKGATTDGSVRTQSAPCEKKFEGVCMDKFDSAAADGSAGGHGGVCEKRVARGGAWIDGGSTARSASRYSEVEEFRDYKMGVRVARDLE